MRLLITAVAVLLSAVAYAHVHEWRLIDEITTSDGEHICSWVCDHSGQTHNIQTIGCWNPND
jgi:hypothetical protein